MDNGQCIRCGEATLEHLVTHTTCLECGFSPDVDAEDLSTWEQLESNAYRRRPESNWWVLRRAYLLPGANT